MNGRLNLLPMKAGHLTARLLMASVATALALQGQTAGAASQKARASESAYLNLPLSFERESEGAGERYVAQGKGYAIGLEKGRAVIGLGAAGSSPKGASGKLISVEFTGGKEVKATPEDELPGKVNRYTGSDPRQWKTGLSTFGKVAYKDVYPGIDVVYYGNQRQLEFDFVVSPGTDPRAIRMKIGGASRLAIDGSGALVIDESRNLRIALPSVYQEAGGVRRKIAGSYELRGKDEVAFALESWDRTKPLVIDPTLVYSGMIGGGTSTSAGLGIALDSAGNIYVAGNTYATDFPSAIAAQKGASLAGDGFVMKINPAGTALLYSTYLGGSGYDALQAIAVDSNGAAWVTGQTQSADFPLLTPLQGAYGGNTDAVVAKLGSGGALQFSTYLGGNSYDAGYSVAVDSGNNAYVAGETQSSAFPTTTGALLTAPAGQQNAFVIKFTAAAARVYSTLAGGSSYDAAYGIAVDSIGDAYITGFSSSSSFAGAPGGGAQTTNAGSQDAYVAKLNPAGTALLYFTFLGGSGDEAGQAIAVDSLNNAYIAGSTNSTGLATTGAAQAAPVSGYDGFIAKLNAAGSAFTYVSYLGGNREDYITGLAVDSSGNAYVGGYTDSNLFPAVAALQPNFPGNPTSLFQTTTTGSGWRGFDTGISGAVLDLSADPVTSGTVLAATENGIFTTTNGGTSWTQSMPLAYVVSLARSPVLSTTIYALSSNNVYLSSDNGATWQLQGFINVGYFEGLVADPVSAGTVYAYSQDSGVYVSTNGGSTWSPANNGLPVTGVPSVVAGSDGSLYASAPGFGIYKSTNHAAGWTAVNTGLPGGATFFTHSLAASGTTIYAGSGSLYKTTNGGATWTATGTPPGGAYIIGVPPSNPSLVYATAYGGGVGVSSDGGATWSAGNAGISSLTQITEFAFDPLNANRAFVVAPVSQVGFVAKLNSTGSSFAYSTWFGAAGGNSYTSINGVAANPGGDVFLTGYSSSDTGGAFPATTTAFDGATFGAWVARISGSTATCGVVLRPGSQTVAGSAQVLGLGAIAPSGCTWSAGSNQSWAIVTRGGGDAGTDAVTVQLAANSTGASRTATISAGGATATITQADSGCVYTLSSSSVNVPATGGTASIGLTTASGCPWSVSNAYPSAVSVTSGATGTGNGTISLSVAPNYGVSSENFYLTIGSAPFLINQAGGCSFTFTPAAASFTAAGGTGSLAVTASGTACSWNASTANAWITLTGTTSGTGNGTVNYSVAANAGALQTGTINVGGFGFTITEAGPVALSSTTSLASSLNPSVFGQNVNLTATVSPSAASGSVVFRDGSNVIGTIPVSAGVAAVTTAILAAGTHSVTAVYSGDATYAGSTSAALTQTVTPLTTSTALTALPNPQTFGGSVAFTATVTPGTATGTIAFSDGSTSLGSIPVTNGAATLNVSSLGVGAHSVTGTYNGDTNDSGSVSPAVSLLVKQATSQTVLTSSANPSAFGKSTTLTATVTPASATGAVTFLDGVTVIGTGMLSSGVATLALATLSAGSHSLTAAYAGDINDTPGVSTALTQTVNQGQTTTFLTFSPNPAAIGQTVTLTAIVTRSAATGTITFKDGDTTITSVPLIGGTASTTISTLTAGPHALNAVYSGDSNFGPGNSQSGPALFFTSAVPETILDTTGQGTGFTARLPGTGRSIPSNDPNLILNTASGSVTLNTTPINLNGQVNVAGGDFIGFPLSSAGVALNEDFSLSATFRNLQFGVASDQIGLFAGTDSSNSFRGGVLYNDGSLAYSVQNIAGADSNQMTSTALAPSPGDDVTFTLSRTAGVWALGIQNLTTPAASGSIPVVQPAFLNGVAGLTAGIYVSNAGNSTVRTETLSAFAFSGAVERVLSATTTTTTTTLTSAPNPAGAGQSVTMTATVSPSSASGTVTFLDGSTTLGSATLSGGVVAFATSGLATGQHSLTASYAGDGTFSPSTSSPVTQTVTTAATSIVLTSSLNPSGFGQNVVFTASVSPGSAVGSVTFSDGTAVLGTAALSGGLATFATAGLTAGAHSITASYAGTAAFAAGVSPVFTQTVNLAATTTSLTSSVNPAQAGQAVTLRAAVSPSSASGTVTFLDGSTALGSAAVSGGVAAFATSGLATGQHSLTASYAGDGTFSSSTSSAVTQTVTIAATSIVLTSSPNPSGFGQNVVFTASISPGSAVGSVTFSDGTTVLGTAALSGGLATFATAGLTAGAHSITASYAGTAAFAAGVSPALTQTVNVAATTITLTSSVNPAQAGQAVTLRAAVTPAGATGSVVFKDGTSTLGTANLSQGTASLTVTLSGGTRSLTAVYSGDQNDGASTSAILSQTVLLATTTTTLTSAPNPAGAGQSVTMTATVSPSSASGTVTFLDGSTALGSAAVSGGVAAFATSGLATGQHSLTASYAGDGTFSSSTSSAVTQTVTIAATSIVLTSSPNPSGFGQNVVFTASISPGSAVGSVTFSDGTTVLGTAALSGGLATFATAGLTAGAHSITASYAGTAAYAAGVSPALTQTVNVAATTITLTSSVNPAQAGQAVTLRAAVTPAGATGSVVFKDGTSTLGTANLSQGTASLTVTLSGGTRSLTAVYSGDQNDGASTSAILSQTVLLATTTTTLTSAPNPAGAGQSVTMTATVSPSSASGTVTFLDGSTALGSATVSGGVAAFATSGLATGQHSLTASYAGDGTFFSPSTSSPVTQTVTIAATSIVLTSSLNPSGFGQNVVFTASISPVSAGGSVTFTDGTTVLGTAALSGGLATFATAGLTAGAHSITASYAGTASYAAGVSPALTQTVNLAATTTTLTSSVNPAQAGQAVTLSAAVMPAGATGSVVFKDVASTLGVANLSQGIASLTIALSGGVHSLTAVYSGDQNNAASTSAILTQTMTLPTISIATSTLPQGMLNQPYGPVLLIASGGSGSYSWSGGGLPSGLSLSGAGSLGGTPTAIFSGTVNVTVTDIVLHATASTSLPLSIVATPLTLNGPATLGSAVTGAGVSAAFTASGGVPPYAWTLTGAPGFTVDSGGHVTGTAGAPGNYQVSLAVTDAEGISASRSLSLSSFGITTGSLPPGTTSANYSPTVTAAGGTPPYSFTASGLPAGVTFSGNSFGGTPTTPGDYSISVRAGDAGGLVFTARYSVTITGSAPLSVFTTSLNDATVGQSYSGTVSAAGGASSYQWSRSGGVLPAGMSFSSSGLVTGTASIAGNYSLGVKVTDGSGAVAVGSVSLHVLPAPLQITSAAAFPNGIAGSEYPSQLLMASGGVAPYTFAIDGSLPDGLTLSRGQIAGTPQTAGTYNFAVVAKDSAVPPFSGRLGVSLNVRQQSTDLLLASSGLSFSITAGTSAPPPASTVGVASSAVSQNIAFSTASSVPWLTLSGGSTTPGVVSVSLNDAALSLTASATPYTGTVTVSCGSGACTRTSQTVAVSLTVTAPPPLLSVGTVLISFASLISNPQPQTASLPVSNAGGGQLQINSATSDSTWLRVSTPPATVPPGPGVSLTVTADPAGLMAGYYRGIVTVSSSGGTASTAVTLFVSGAATISLGPSGTQFSLPQNGALGFNKGSFSVNASNGASVPFTASVIGATWLTVTDAAGTATTGVPANVGFTIDGNAASTFAAGAYYGTIRVSAAGVANSPEDFLVVLNVTPATSIVIPDPEPAGLVFVSAGSATPASQTINVFASSRTTLPFQASASTDNGSWLSIAPTTGSASASAPGAVTVTANPAGLAAGAYRGLVSFAFGSSVRSVNVTLIVEPLQNGRSISAAAPRPLDSAPVCANAQLVPTQTGLVQNFSVPTAWPTPLTVQLFDNCGSIVGNARVVATFSNGDPPLSLTTVSTGTGVYSGTWTPRTSTSQLTISASVTAPGYPAALVKISGQTPPNSAPVLAPNGAGDVFNPQVGAGLGPGNIIQIYGSGLASVTSTPAVLPLPTTFTGTSVIIGGVQAPLFFVSPTQINAQIPFSLLAGNQYQLLVSANGALTTPISLNLNAGTPSILNFSSGAVIAQHLDGTLVLPTSPATPGEYIVIYSSGLGATDIPVVSGAASPSNPPANVAVPPVLTLNGNPITVLFAGLTPGLVGLYQVNFQIPADLGAGNYDLQLRQSATPSNTTVLPVALPVSKP